MQYTKCPALGHFRYLADALSLRVLQRLHSCTFTYNPFMQLRVIWSQYEHYGRAYCIYLLISCEMAALQKGPHGLPCYWSMLAHNQWNITDIIHTPVFTMECDISFFLNLGNIWELTYSCAAPLLVKKVNETWRNHCAVPSTNPISHEPWDTF